MGDAFFPSYRTLLMDTGRMTAEDLARKHLDVALDKPEFWRTTLDSMKARVDVFEGLLDEVDMR
jgi:oligoendopeptidase F